MSILSIDADSYHRIALESLARYRRRGYSTAEAMRISQNLMDQCFVIDTTLATHEGEADQKESGIYG